MDARATTTATSSTTRSTSDEETSYATISSAPPKRRAGRTKFCETRHPTFKGVRRRNPDRWVCEVREPSKKSRIWLGTFPTAEMAARAHDVAAIALRGRSACLNFADSAWLLPVPESKSPGDIKRAAAMAAEAFRPRVDADGPGVNPTARDGWTSDRRGGDAVGEDGSEFLFGDEMQGYFDMAQGMLIDPPPPLMSDDVVEEGEGDGESMSLWGYSF